MLKKYLTEKKRLFSGILIYFKVGHSDPLIIKDLINDQQIKGTLGITG
jgi:hypothetical protein